MDFDDVYVLALRVQIAAALRELLRVETAAEPSISSMHLDIGSDGEIDVRVYRASLDDSVCYSL